MKHILLLLSIIGFPLVLCGIKPANSIPTEEIRLLESITQDTVPFSNDLEEFNSVNYIDHKSEKKLLAGLSILSILATFSTILWYSILIWGSVTGAIALLIFTPVIAWILLHKLKDQINKKEHSEKLKRRLKIARKLIMWTIVITWLPIVVVGLLWGFGG